MPGVEGSPGTGHPTIARPTCSDMANAAIFSLSDERFASTSMAGRAAFMVESGDGRGLFQTDFRLQSCRHNLRIFVV